MKMLGHGCVVGVFVVLALFAVTGQGVATSWEVQVGYGVNSNVLFDVAWATLAYFPQNVTVNVGDTVTFIIVNDAHTVTFAPAVIPIFSDPTTLAVSPQLFVYVPPGTVGNGSVTTPVVIANTSSTYSSGVMAQAGLIPGFASQWSVTFATPGTYFYFCMIHFNMLGYVIVNSAGTAYPQTQAQVNDSIATQQETLLNELSILDARVKLYPTGELFANGSALINIDDGYGDQNLHFSLNVFGPSYFEANVGDTINFVLGDTAVGHTLALNGSNFFDWPPDGLLISEQGLFGSPLWYLKYGNANPWNGQFVSGGFLSQGYAENQGTYQSFSLTIGDLAANGFGPLPKNFTFLCNIHSTIIPNPAAPGGQIYVGMTGQMLVSAAGSPRPSYFSNSTYFTQPGSPPPPPPSPHSSASHHAISFLLLAVVAVLMLLWE